MSTARVSMTRDRPLQEVSRRAYVRRNTEDRGSREEKVSPLSFPHEHAYYLLLEEAHQTATKTKNAKASRNRRTSEETRGNRAYSIQVFLTYSPMLESTHIRDQILTLHSCFDPKRMPTMTEKEAREYDKNLGTHLFYQYFQAMKRDKKYRSTQYLAFLKKQEERNSYSSIFALRRKINCKKWNQTTGQKTNTHLPLISSLWSNT